MTDKVHRLQRIRSKIFQNRNRAKELEAVKEYVMTIIPEGSQPQAGAQSEPQAPKVAEGERYMPNNLTLHKLHKDRQQLLMVGVDKTNLEHCLFIKDLADRLEIKTCMTQIAPDSPYLINTDKSVREAWHQFILGRDYSFYLSNKPKYLQEAMLDRAKIAAYKSNIFKSQEFSAELSYGLEFDENTRQFEPNAFLSPLFCQETERIVFCDYPMLKEREYQANSMTLGELRELFRDFVGRLHSGNLKNFDPRLLHYKKMLQHKVEHITGVLKLGSLLEDRTIAVVDRQYTEFVAEAWKSSRKPACELFSYEAAETGGPFIEFIEKLVILDLVLEPLVERFFIKYKRFPYSIKNKVGGPELASSLFLIWKFYYSKYHQAKYPDLQQKQ